MGQLHHRDQKVTLRQLAASTTILVVRPADPPFREYEAKGTPEPKPPPDVPAPSTAPPTTPKDPSRAEPTQPSPPMPAPRAPVHLYVRRLVVVECLKPQDGARPGETIEVLVAEEAYEPNDHPIILQYVVDPPAPAPQPNRAAGSTPPDGDDTSTGGDGASAGSARPRRKRGKKARLARSSASAALASTPDAAPSDEHIAFFSPRSGPGPLPVDPSHPPRGGLGAQARLEPGYVFAWGGLRLPVSRRAELEALLVEEQRAAKGWWQRLWGA